MQQPKYPFQLLNAFFIALHFERQPELPNLLNMNLVTIIQVVDKDYPHLQINLKTETPKDDPLKLSIELIGLFDLVQGQTLPDRNVVPIFVEERALHMLWPYMAQMIRLVTGQMGMNPLNIQTPVEFEVQRESQDEKVASP